MLHFLPGSARLRPETPDLTIRLVLQDRVLIATTRRTLSDTALGDKVSSPPNPTAQEHSMKAIVQDRYGGPEVLEFRDIDQPVPTDNQVLVKVKAAGVHRGD